MQEEQGSGNDSPPASEPATPSDALPARPPPREPRCRYCEEPINEGASICRACGQPQRRCVRWAPLVFDFLRALGGVAVLIGAGVFVYRAYLEEPALAITDFDELSAITITNRSTQPIYVLRARWDAVSDPSLSRQLRMPQEITIAETVAPDGGTIHRDLEPRVDYGAHNAHSVPLDENALREIAELKPYEIRYFMLDDRVREKPLPLGARMTIEFVWRGSSRTEVVPIGAFLYKLHSRAKPES